jgi:epoxyqueuosine reductase
MLERTPAGLRETIRARAAGLGLPRTGFAPVTKLPHLDHLARWLGDGCAGDMAYLEDRPARRGDPTTLLEVARSAIVVALPILGSERELDGEQPAPGRGLIARFARRLDYHTDLQRRLRRLAAMIGEEIGRPLRFAIAVDAAPLLGSSRRRPGSDFSARTRC